MSARSIPAPGVVPGPGDLVPSALAAPGLDRATLAFFLAFVGTLHFSIVVSQACLAASLVLALIQVARTGEWPAVPAFAWPLVAYAVVSLVSAAFSMDPAASFQPLKKLLLFLIIPLAVHVARGRRATAVIEVTLTLGGISALVGVIQYGVLEYNFLGQRPHGLLGHYMTYSGLVMLVICVAVGRLVFGDRQRTWSALLMPALVMALAVTFTRSAWVGACVGVGLLFLLRDFRLVAVLPIVVALVFALAPDTLTKRMMSMFDLRDPTNRDRVAMLETGMAIIKDHPLTGVGPNMIERVYPQYRRPDAVQKVNPHLHNVPLQLAAERGLVALATWLWFVVVLVRELWRVYRRKGMHRVDRMLAATALSAVAAMLSAGMFEHNFGDSEFLMLFLVLVTLPFAALRADDAAPVTRAA